MITGQQKETIHSSSIFPLAKMSMGTDHIRKGAHSSYIKKAKSGRQFDGVIQGASVGLWAEGHLFGSDEYPDGIWIETARILKVSNVLAIGCWIETLDGKRYLISEPTDKNWYELLSEYLDINSDVITPIHAKVWGSNEQT